MAYIWRNISHKRSAPQDNHWRDRALKSEEKLKMLKSAMQGWLKKI